MKPTLVILKVMLLLLAGAAALVNAANLDARHKAIIPVAAFTATGNQKRLEETLHEGLNAGLTVNEIKEMMVHIYAYAGFPRALNGINTFMKVLEERKSGGISDKEGREAKQVWEDMDRNSYGHKVRNTLVGRDISKRTSGYPVFVPVIDKFLVEHLFADIFVRDVFSYQDRELVTISVLAAMGGTEAQLRGHYNISMNVGFSESQLNDFVSVLNVKVNSDTAEKAAETLKGVLAKASAPASAKAVKVIKHEPDKISKAPADRFTGDATVHSRFASGEPNSYSGGVVNFEAGARTAWHTHPLGQTLIVTAGRGLVQSEGEAMQEILPGDVVWIPAGERHWHGAASESPMSHVAILDALRGKRVDWMEPVSDVQYKANIR